jgi:hypothetical protein
MYTEPFTLDLYGLYRLLKDMVRRQSIPSYATQSRVLVCMR